MKIEQKSKKIVTFLGFGESKPNLDKLEQIHMEPLPKFSGKTNIKVIITEKEQINEIIHLVRQCYELQSKRRKIQPNIISKPNVL